MKFSNVIWATIAVGLLSACQSVMDRRISAHKETWRGLSEQDKSRLRRGFMFVGDTEDMVSIALGLPDKKLPIAGPEGQKQTVWLYEVLDDECGSAPNDPSSTPHWVSREQRVVFQNGVVVDHVGFEADQETLARLRTRVPDRMIKRLDALVALAPDQQVQARAILAQATGKLLDLAPNEYALNGKPVGEKMRADIRAILTADQQAKFDAGATIAILGW